MAEVVLGFGSSHGPTMVTKPENWAALGEEDKLDVRFDFEAARKRAKPGLEAELTLDVFRRRYDALQTDIAALTQVMNDAKPDVVVVISNPHGGVSADRMQPTFGIHLNDAPPFTERPGRGGQSNQPDPKAAAARQYPTDADLARHLMNGLIEEGIDVAANFQSRPGAGLDQAYNLLYQSYDKEGALPYVPVLVSRYLPNQATPRRSYQFGQALRRVIDRWDSSKRVAIMASGGLSHQVIDEDLDQAVITALTQGNPEALTSLDRDRLNASPGTPEILNWVIVAAAMEPKTMQLIDYQPCYRSLAGTGHGVTFGYWK